jgi:hypothetical protein
VLLSCGRIGFWTVASRRLLPLAFATGVLLIASAAWSRAGEPPPGSNCAVAVVHPEAGPRRDRFISWLKVHWKESGWRDAELLGYFDGPTPSIESLELRIADIDNDGADEYTLTAHEGSGGYLKFWVFRSSGEGWVLAKSVFDEEMLGQDFVDPITGESQFLVRFCGKTYLNLAGGRPPYASRQTTAWEKGERRVVCDAAWIQQQRGLFQALFDAKRFDAAHGFLDGVQGECGSAAEPESWLWMQSDLALTAYRMGQAQDCREHVATAQKSQAFRSGGERVRKALAANAALCGTAAAKGVGAAGYDFTWLITELKANPDRQIVLDPRYGELLSAIVPEKTLEDGQSLRDALTLSIFLPDPAEIAAGRYLLISGCQPHDCGNKGFIWIDTVSRKAIVGTGGLLGSTTVSSGAIPSPFWAQAGRFAPGPKADYIEPGGETKTVEVP